MQLLIGICCCLNLIGSSIQSSVFERTFNRLHSGPPLPYTTKSTDTVTTHWIEQKLDNFAENETRTWKMRYLANAEHYKPGGPIFIYVGGEWTVQPVSIKGGHFYDLAKQHNAYLFYTEHRYYGESKPTIDLSTTNLKYLHVKQALADLAHFITVQKATIEGAKDSKVILAGGSYSATMVTWFKKLYPELAAGCWASSAPLFAKLDFYEYKEVTGSSIRRIGSEECYDRIASGIDKLESLFAERRGAEVKAMLTICAKFNDTNNLDLWTLFSEISDIFAGVVQSHDGTKIQRACKTIMAADTDIAGLVRFLYETLHAASSDKCIDLSYNAMISKLKETKYNGGAMRQWLYQTCNEYGWYQTSSSKAQPFGDLFPVELYTKMCSDAYSDVFTPRYIAQQIEGTNKAFGGLNPQVKNVYMTHGTLDPWHAMGIQEPEQSTMITDYAHCKDLSSISEKDTKEMRASKQKIADLVRQWLSSK